MQAQTIRALHRAFRPAPAAFLAGLALLLSGPLSVGLAQGTITITFDGPPAQAPGTSAGVPQYFESGVLFTPLPGSVLILNGGGSGFPDDGTAYLQVEGTASFSFVNGSLFGVGSVDLAGYSTVLPDFTVDFVGYHPNGNTVTAEFSGSGINFQTFQFGSGWSGLSSVNVTDETGSMDNLLITVPEPGACPLIILGLVSLSAFAARRPKHGQGATSQRRGS